MSTAQVVLAVGGCAEMICSIAYLPEGSYVTVIDIIGDIANVEDISHEVHTVMVGDLRPMSEDE